MQNFNIDFNKLKGTNTEKNLRAAFSGESEARNKYDYFSSVAKKEGYEFIADIFKEISDNEKEHAKIWFKILQGISNTKENLENAINGEKYENEIMYPKFAKEAKEEGFELIARLFEKVLDIEKRHENTYGKILEKIKNNSVFKSEEKVAWICLKCGNVEYGNEPPNLCSVCLHPKSYFKITNN